MERKEKDILDNLLSELECVICTKHMTAPIYQCSTGHNICGNCRKSLAACGLCQAKYSGTRNFSLERLATDLMPSSCPNKPYGCSETPQRNSMDLHKQKCQFRFKCSERDCEWQGCRLGLKEHWLKRGHLVWMVNPSANVKFDVTKNEDLLLLHFNEYFWLKQRIDKGYIFWLVQFIGSKEEAMKYRYTLVITNPISCRRVTLSDVSQPTDSTQSEDIVIKNVCTNINEHQARLLSASRKITIGLTIQQNHNIPGVTHQKRIWKRRQNKSGNLTKCKSMENILF